MLVDNDILIKLAHWDLLDLVPSIADSNWTEVSVLAQFPPRVARCDTKLFESVDAARRLLDRLNQTTALPLPDRTSLALMQGRPDLDIGEILLISALVAEPQSLLMTGDKRALRALASDDLRPVATLVQRRTICMEQILWHGLDLHGVHLLTASVRQYLDQTTLAIFGREGNPDESAIRQGLASYANHLNNETTPLLTLGWGIQK